MERQGTSKRSRLRQFNNWLSAVIIMMALYILISPLIPQLTFWVNTRTSAQPELVRAEKKGETPSYPKENTLVIPALGLQTLIHEGATEATLSKGVWHRPRTGSPDGGGNTVLAGHRYTYSDPAVFYHLDKLKVGDDVILYWGGKKYVYVVNRSYVTHPGDAEVEKSTERELLTLYTCTPLWTSRDRLVVTAEPKEVR